MQLMPDINNLSWDLGAWSHILTS